MTTQPHTKNPSRKRPPSLVYVELSSVNGGMMRDIAEDSFALRAMIPVRAGEKTPFRFSLDEATRIEGEGLIDAIEEDGRVANIRILEISAVARKQLLDWLTRPDAPPAHVPPAPQSNSAPNSSLEELRNELRTVVPAKSSGEAPQQLPANRRPNSRNPRRIFHSRSLKKRSSARFRQPPLPHPLHKLPLNLPPAISANGLPSPKSPCPKNNLPRHRPIFPRDSAPPPNPPRRKIPRKFPGLPLFLFRHSTRATSLLACSPPCGLPPPS